MADKDFLSQFSGSDKPESFKEEERTPVVKEKKPVNKIALIVVIAVLILASILGYFLFLAPKIEMPDFLHKTKSDVTAWVKQQQIETSGIIFNEEYNFDYDADTILSQDVKAGTKVKNNVKITFLISKGADPDELIKVPDIKAMEKDDIKDWISKNKLTKTKITTVYDENVEIDKVISYVFSGSDEDTFTRSSTLKINISKGPAPAGVISVEDFVKKDYSVVETWAASKKVKVEKVESYSNDIPSGYVMSQSVEAGKTLKEGESLRVVVSKGKAVTVTNLCGKMREDAEAWCSDNGLSARTVVRYSGNDSNYGEVIEQSIASGTVVAAGETIELTISKGKLRPSTFTGTSKEELRNWIKDANQYGAELYLGNAHYEINDDVPAGQIISIYFNGKQVEYIVSRGKNIYIEDKYSSDGYDALRFEDVLTEPYTEAKVRALCKAANVSCSISYVTVPEPGKIGDVHSIKRSDGIELKAGTYITEDTPILIEIIGSNN